jgi:hypothetical protein
VAVLLLGIHFALSSLAIFAKSPTFDESVHLTGGYSYWKLNDYRINPEGGNFPQRWAALPLIFDNSIRLPLNDRSWGDAQEWFFSYKFLFKSGNDTESIFRRTKIMMVFLSLALGLAVFLISKEIFGTKGGLVSLFLYSFSPTFIAHSNLVTSDLSAALFFILSVYFIRKTLAKVNPANLLFCSISLALLFLSKMSAPLIIPVYLILILLRLGEDEPTVLEIGNYVRMFDVKYSRLKPIAAVVLLNFIFVYVSIWAAYGYRFTSVPEGSPSAAAVELQWNDLLRGNDALEKIVIAADKFELLPHAHLQGYLYVKKHSEKRYSFLNGEQSLEGVWYFFPYCFAVKTPIPTMLIILIAIAGLCFYPDKLRALSPFAALAFIFAIFAITSRINIGERHIMPLYPCLFIACGAAAKFISGKSNAIRVLTGLCMAWLALETLNISPHFLAYFNQFAGGPKNGYRHLVDSSLDWGQDLKELKRIKDGLNPEKGEKRNFYLSYFGTASINSYGLDDVISLPGYFAQENFRIHRYEPGYYCVSATMLWMLYYPDILGSLGYPQDMLYNNTFEKISPMISPLFDAADKGDSKLREFISEKGEKFWLSCYKAYDLIRFAKLCAYLQKTKPDYQAGHSILIYDLNEKEIAEINGL